MRASAASAPLRGRRGRDGEREKDSKGGRGRGWGREIPPRVPAGAAPHTRCPPRRVAAERRGPGAGAPPAQRGPAAPGAFRQGARKARLRALEAPCGSGVGEVGGGRCVWGGGGRKRGKRHPASPGGVLRSVAFLAVWLPAGELRPGPPLWHGSAPLAASTGPPAESRDRAVCKAAAAARRGPSPAPRDEGGAGGEDGTPLPCAPNSSSPAPKSLAGAGTE